MSNEPVVPVPTETPSPHEGTAELSMSEHAALFSADTKVPPGMTPGLSPAQPAEPGTAPPAEAAQPEPRARERHRAQNDKPGVLIPRLKADLKAAQEELARLRHQGAPAAQVQTARAEVQRAEQPVQPAPPAAAPARAAVAYSPASDPNDPQPQQDDPKYANGQASWADYIRDDARWAAREAIRQHEATQQRQRAEQGQVQAWKTRVDTAKAKYPDYERVAFVGDPGWPMGSVFDQFVREDDAGAEMLYHLQSHPEERDNLLRLPSVLAQAKALSLLSQRLLSTSTALPGTSGAGARRTRELPPTPPTPVRTEAQRPSGQRAVSDGSLSISEHARAFASNGRRPH